MIGRLLGAQPGVTGIMTDIENYVKIANLVFWALCGVGLTLFAIYIGFRMAKAEDAQKQKQAKEQLIYSIIGLIACVAIAGLMNIVVPKSATTVQLASEGVRADFFVAVNTGLYVPIQRIVAGVTSIISMLVGMFAVYIGFQLMKAEDESKRTNAKKQLFWAVCGVIGCVILQVLAKEVLAIVQASMTPANWAFGGRL